MASTGLYELVSLIAALSVASERLVEILKGIIPWLGKPKDDATYEERLRGAALQALAVLAGVITAYLGADYFPANLRATVMAKNWSVVGLGLLASGGSGLWNSVLSYLSNVKEIRKAAAVDAKKIAGIV